MYQSFPGFVDVLREGSEGEGSRVEGEEERGRKEKERCEEKRKIIKVDGRVIREGGRGGTERKNGKER